MSFANLEKTDMIFDLWRTFRASKANLRGKLPQRILRNARTFVNVAQNLRDFGRFEMDKRDLDRQREDRRRRHSSRNPRASHNHIKLFL
jgi:hypothetical protein